MHQQKEQGIHLVVQRHLRPLLHEAKLVPLQEVPDINPAQQCYLLCPLPFIMNLPVIVPMVSTESNDVFLPSPSSEAQS